MRTRSASFNFALRILSIYKSSIGLKFKNVYSKSDDS